MFSLHHLFIFFFFNDTATTEIYTLSLHDALPIFWNIPSSPLFVTILRTLAVSFSMSSPSISKFSSSLSEICSRSEEHTSELQSQSNLVCRLLLEKKKTRPPSASRSGLMPTLYSHP